MPEDVEQPGRWRTALRYAGPLLLLLAVAVLPLVRGTETLILRDVLNSHFPMKWSQAEAMRSGTFPLIDPYRAGGQPIAGNLNAVPFYPDNVLYLLGSTFWAFNAHFWLHLLLAPFAFYWMCRSWGLGREASWAAAACWTVSGFYLSHLNFYNLIAGATLAPALIAACLGFVRPGLRRGLLAPAVAVLWTLLILGGDPQTAMLAFLLAGTAVVMCPHSPGPAHPQGARGIRAEPVPAFLPPLPRGEEGRGGEGPAAGARSHRIKLSALALLIAAFAVGTLIALPQIVEFLRVLPLSFRGHVGYSVKGVTTASWDPRQAAEWLIPFVFGRPDLLSNGGFWGSQFFTGVPPYYLSLYPGLLTLALIAATGRPRGRAAL